MEAEGAMRIPPKLVAAFISGFVGAMTITILQVLFG